MSQLVATYGWSGGVVRGVNHRREPAERMTGTTCKRAWREPSVMGWLMEEELGVSSEKGVSWPKE